MRPTGAALQRQARSGIRLLGGVLEMQRLRSDFNSREERAKIQLLEERVGRLERQLKVK
jgi:hypothetical protein